MDNRQHFEIIKNANAGKLETLDYEGFIGGLDRNGLNIVLSMLDNSISVADREKLHTLWKNVNIPPQVKPMTIRVKLSVDENDSTVFLVPLDRSVPHVEEQLISYFSRKNDLFVGRREVDFSSCRLFNANNERVVDLSVIVAEELYRFVLPTQVLVESACYWTESKLQALGISVNEVYDASVLLSDFNFKATDWFAIEQERDALLEPLSSLDHSLAHNFAANKMKEEVLTTLTPLIKSVLVVKKYPQMESAVDLMVSFLLNHCGFYEKRLFAFPQFPLKLFYGEKTAEAKPDFTILDLQSYYRIAVVEDKPQYDPTIEVNFEAQLIAEAIAMAQANIAKDECNHIAKKQKTEEGNNDNIMLGIRVLGTLISFYVIPVTSSILDALRTRTSVPGVTNTEVMTTKFYDSIYLEERMEILKLLCCYRKIAEEENVIATTLNTSPPLTSV